MPLMSWLRVTSIADGVSLLFLFFIAMPMKYLGDRPEVVTWAGGIHGFLFLSLCFLLLAAMLRASLPFRLAFLTGVAAVIPAAPFFVDRRLRTHQENLPSAPLQNQQHA